MKHFGIIFILLSVIHSRGAGQQNVYFMKNDGREVSVKDSADFIRIIKAPDSGSVFYPVLEYYTNNQRKFVGQVSAYEPWLVFQGPTISYFNTGKRKANIEYKDGLPNGLGYFYFETGRLWKTVVFSQDGSQRIVSAYDSMGKEVIKEGSGYLIERNEETGEQSEGYYRDGVKEGLWKGQSEAGDWTFEEIFLAGQLKEGKRYSPSGQVFTYSVPSEPPKFPGGDDAFGRFLSRTLKYPTEARNARIIGRVTVEFNVEADGKLTDVHVVGPVHYLLDREAVRVLRMSPRWIPGKKRGLPTPVTLRVPISFNLGSVF